MSLFGFSAGTRQFFLDLDQAAGNTRKPAPIPYTPGIRHKPTRKMPLKTDGRSIAYFERVPLRFSCTGCGHCCTGGPDYVVEVSRSEQRRIQAYLGISWRWFRRRYLRRLDDGSESLQDSGNACIFLDGGRQCRIYAVRPTQCRSYPFWPTLLMRERDWKAEARRCEGIGRGPVVSVAAIRARLSGEKK